MLAPANSSKTDQVSFSSGRVNVLLEQYKLYVESTDRFMRFRNQANAFFLTLNTALVGLVAALLGSDHKPAPVWYIAACVAGMKTKWDILQTKKPKHIPLTPIKQIVPAVYILLYAAITVIILR